MLANAHPVAAGKVIDKHAVAVSFSRAALSYDGVANIQRWVIKQMLNQMAFNQPPEKILDIGCGTGHLTLEVAKQCQPKSIIGLDIAEEMVKVAAQKFQADAISNTVECAAVCGDAELMTFDDETFSGAVSSFALQWCPDLPKALQEIYRTLKPGGQCFFTLPVGDTLKELKACWQSIDPNNTHVNDFYSAEEVRGYCEQAGFSRVAININTIEEYYPDLKALTHALKAMGAHNVTSGRAKQLTGRNKIKQLKDCYEKRRMDQGLPATWDVVFGVLEK